MRNKNISAAVALALAGFGGAAHAAPPLWYYSVGSITVTDLGTLSGDDSSGAFGINDLGDVVGTSVQPNANASRAFIHLDGQMYSLHSGDPATVRATAHSINNDRVAVGEYWTADGVFLKPFYYYPGIWLFPGGGNPTAPLFTWDAVMYSINNSHQIAGWAGRHPMQNDPPVPNTPGACYHQLPVRWPNAGANPAMLYCPTDPDDNGLANGSVKALDIADNGSIVGQDGFTSVYSMFLWKNGTRSSVPWIPGFPATNQSGNPFEGVARGVNSNDWVVGNIPYYHSGSGSYKVRAFVWKTGSLISTDIGMLSGGTWSQLNKINDSNMAVGAANRQYASGVTDAAVIWHEDFGLKQLPSPWLTGTLQSLRPTNCEARAVSERVNGVVRAAGYCKMPSGKSRAVRWDITVNKVIVGGL